MKPTRFVYIPEWALSMFQQGQGLVRVENVQMTERWLEAFGIEEEEPIE